MSSAWHVVRPMGGVRALITFLWLVVMGGRVCVCVCMCECVCVRQREKEGGIKLDCSLNQLWLLPGLSAGRSNERTHPAMKSVLHSFPLSLNKCMPVCVCVCVCMCVLV